MNPNLTADEQAQIDARFEAAHLVRQEQDHRQYLADDARRQDEARAELARVAEVLAAGGHPYGGS